MFALVEVIRASGENKPIVINNPILFDASCSGIQHLSALTRELDTAIHTNLVSLDEKDNVAKDFYIYASKIIQKEIDNCDNDNIKKIKINRAFAKPKVMLLG